ncbi:MAG TPA: L,D-transpeptidase family protein [Chloroflexota bacterium]|nr:L,D-transpeptidase family protein [Chloroflexota bacterium]
MNVVSHRRNYRFMERRAFLKIAAGLPASLLAAQAAPAFADSKIVDQGGQYVTTYTPGGANGWTGYTSAGGVGYSYVYLYSGPTSQSTWLANVPVNQAVTVNAYAPGEILAPPNPLWFNVSAPQGNGWVYSGLVSNVPPVTLPASTVAPPPGPIPAPVGSGRSIGVSLSRQHLWAYDNGSVAWEAPVTTGGPEKPTPTGIYTIEAKIPNFKFISPWPPSSPFWYPDSPTHYALQFRSDGFYIHDAPWRPYYGPGTDFPHVDPDGTVRSGSHGCVNTQYATIAFLAPWTPMGAPVRIID